MIDPLISVGKGVIQVLFRDALMILLPLLIFFRIAVITPAEELPECVRWNVRDIRAKYPPHPSGAARFSFRTSSTRIKETGTHVNRM